jgi:hypothetical protein
LLETVGDVLVGDWEMVGLATTFDFPVFLESVLDESSEEGLYASLAKMVLDGQGGDEA